MKKSTKLSALVAGFLLPAMVLNAQSWMWGKDIPASSAIESRGIATDNNRNNYVVSNFDGTATYGTTSLVSSGSYDVALSKMDEDGNYLWSIPVCVGAGDDHGMAVTCDPTGNEIYVTGYFSGTATFGSTVLNSAGTADIFIAKYNSAGVLSWAVSAGGTGYDQAVDITWIRCPGICKGNYIFLTGTFSGTATFGSTSITSATGTSVFTALYSGYTGANSWVQQASASYSAIYSSAITVDANYNVYVTGAFAYTGTFGSLSLTSAGNYDQFLLKYNSAGTEQWVRKGGGTATEEGKDLRTDASGNIFVCGNYQSGTATFGSFTLAGNGSVDISIVKYDPAGTEQWASKCASSNSDDVRGLVLDAANNIFITGTFYSSSLVLGSLTLVPDASSDLFVARLTPSGVFDMAISPSASPSYSTMWPDDISVNSLGHVFITGDYDYSFTFGTSTISSGGPQHGFVAKLRTPLWPVVTGTTGGDYAYSMDADAAGNVYETGFQANATFTRKINCNGAPQWMRYSTIVCGPSNGSAVIADASGNVYCAGDFSCSVMFGATTLTVTGLNSGSFLVKYDASGNLLWAEKIAEGTNTIVKDMTLDASGNVYITGGFYTSATFGPGSPVVLSTSPSGNEDAFLAKYNASGGMLWAVNACAGSARDEGCGVTVSGASVLVSGMFGSTATFNSGLVSATSTGLSDMFLAKYNSSGVGQAVLSGGGTLADQLFDLTSLNGYAYITGQYRGSGSFGGYALVSGGNVDGILAKVNVGSMTVSWLHEVKNVSQAEFTHVDVTSSAVYALGDFFGTTTFGDGTTSPTLTSAGGEDIFIEKFDLTGTYQWVKQTGGVNHDYPAGIGMDSYENAYICGNFDSNTTLAGVTYYCAGGTGDVDYFTQKFAGSNGVLARLASNDPASEEAPALSGTDQVLVHPNPFSDYTTLEIPVQYTGAYTLVLYDISGRVVYTQEGELGSPVKVERNGLAPGIYTWTIFTKDVNVGLGKMIIQ